MIIGTQYALDDPFKRAFGVEWTDMLFNRNRPCQT